MIDEMIIDADLCIKLGSSEKHNFLQCVLPLVARTIYIHSHVFNEVRYPLSARKQLVDLVSDDKVIVINETELEQKDRVIYDIVYKNLAMVMIDPRSPNKNKGEVSSLAYAKVKSIPIFATDENDLQLIIDSRLNTGIDDINCLRIVDIINMAKNENLLPRKVAKAIWVVSGKSRKDFDHSIWPLDNSNMML